MKIAFITNMKFQYKRVYVNRILDELKNFGELSMVMNAKDLEKNKDFLQECEYIFSTWGMCKLTKEQIKTYFPKVKALFYAAGTVQYFAKPFLECGIRVYSAFAANAIPVIEYTVAQIILANKGYFQSAKYAKFFLPVSSIVGRLNFGNYKAKVGIIGLGAMGSMVAKKLPADDIEILAYDPFVSVERAKELNVKLVDLPTLFKESNVISNHLANKKELKNVLNKDLFKLMKKNATFINTGRGAQVKEWDLAMAMLFHPKRTAVLDVLKNEILTILSPLWWCPNVILTPHIAGSSGYEVTRMGDFMVEEFKKFIKDEPTQYEVTLEKLKTMA